VRRPRLPQLLGETAFRRFWLGQSVSLVGDQISLLAIPLVAVLVLHADAAEMGYLVATGLVPSLLLSLMAGAWLDRRGQRRRHMIAADAGRAAALVSIPIAGWLHALALPQLYIVAFVIGSFDVVFNVAYSSLFVSLARREQYVEANTLLNASRAVSQVSGQSAAGALVAALTAPVALLVDAVSFVVSAVFLCSINPREAPTSARRRSLLEGARFIATSATVRRMLAVSATLNFFNFMYSAVFVLFAVTELGVGPAALGLVLGVGATGAVLGTFLVGPLTRGAGLGWAYVIGCVLFPAPLVLVPVAPPHNALTYMLLGVAEFTSGIGLMLFDITAGSIQAAVVPGELRSRVAGAYRTVNYGIRPLGALIGGLMGAAVGLRPTLFIGVAGAALCGLWLIGSSLVSMASVGAWVTVATD
jgi:MFS family permease